MKTWFLTVVLVLLAVSCSGSSESTADGSEQQVAAERAAPRVEPTLDPDDLPDIARFDASGGNPITLPFDQRAPAPEAAIAPYFVEAYGFPATAEDMMADAEAAVSADQTLVVAELSGCILITAWALPEPDRVLVGFEEDPNAACTEPFDYQAIFVIETSGTSAAGEWDYSAGIPAIELERQPVGG